jgi:hypothetical protein
MLGGGLGSHYIESSVEPFRKMKLFQQQKAPWEFLWSPSGEKSETPGKRMKSLNQRYWQRWILKTGGRSYVVLSAEIDTNSFDAEIC